MTWQRQAALALMVASLAACSSLLPRVEPPRLTLASLQMATVTSEGLAVTVVLDLDNANAQDIRIDALDFAIVVSGVTVATAHSDEPIVLGANASGHASISARGEFASWTAALRQVLARPSFEYQINGTARVNGRVLPFTRRGEMKTGAFMGLHQ